jgi:hypothetical protein
MLRRLIQTGPRATAVSALVLTAALVAVAAAAAGVIVPQRPAPFAATFDTRAVEHAAIDFCRGLGPEGQKIEGRYQGTMTIDGEEFAFNFTTLEILLDRSTGLGTAEGTWQLGDRSGELVGRGEIIAVVNMAEPPDPDLEPPDPDLELQGVVTGLLEPPDPDLPAQRLLGNFAASLGDGTTFPHLKGTVGDPSVGDPSGPAASPAVLMSAVNC